ncbi:MAG: alpha-1,2-fucosyltransferase [Alphaproteobacteria bacterium]|nr:alpha-1,2-fucosyltransferase [Alphaproteobacteria bacterium]
MPEFDNAIIFDFSGGLADQVRYLANAFDLYKNGKLCNYKIYLNTTGADAKWDGFKLGCFDVESAMNFEYITIPRESLKPFDESGNYISDMKDFVCDILRPRHSLPKTAKIMPPMLIRQKFGDFCTWKWLPEFRKAMKLIKPLDAANSKMLAKIKKSNAVCLHIRRMDYINRITDNYSLGAVSAEYVNRAVAEIRRYVDAPHFFIFSQDFDWVKNNVDFAGADYEFVTVNDNSRAEFELELMKNCKHFILSCGGFARLASNLCANPDKIIIAPDVTNANDWEILTTPARTFRTFRKKLFARRLVRKWRRLNQK